MMLNEYEKTMFLNFETLSVNSGWFNIKKDRADLDRFVVAIKKRIEIHNDFEFNNDYSRFRRIDRFVAPTFNEITYKIEFDDHLVQLPYDHLPTDKIKAYNEKEWKLKKGRAI